MASPVLIAAPVALIPAVAALWYLLKRYEMYFDDARVFMSLTVGFFAGLVVIAMERLLFPFESPVFRAEVGAGTAFLFFVVGYALFETAAKLVVLGSRAYRMRKDTPYYGAALGLGMGTMMALGYIAINMNVADALAQQDNRTAGALGTSYGILPFVSMALLPIGAVLAHGATGVWVGRATAKGQLWQGWLIGAALQAPVLGMFWLFSPHVGQGNVIVMEPGLMSIVYGALLLHITRKRVLDHVVPKEILDQVRRDERRKAREAGRPHAVQPGTAPDGAAETQDQGPDKQQDQDPEGGARPEHGSGPHEGDAGDDPEPVADSDQRRSQ